MIRVVMFAETVSLVCLISGVFGISENVTVGGLGNVIGSHQYSAWTNRTIYTFRGIPYAEPSIGDLRFRPPVSITTWNGTLYAKEFGNICPQKSGGQISEDCLTLNVYVPEVLHGNSTLPVMIWIHGGTFMSGSASSFEPHYLLEEDVILVVPQFRLGPFGLLCLQTDEVPGNVQFLDQIMAMQWVQNNIRYFGGNPDEVTLFGQSSGAATVNLHQFSPLSKGLFHRAILQSGSAFAPWVMDHNPLDTAAKLGSVVGCNQTNVTELAACFRGLDVLELVDGLDSYLASHNLAGIQTIGGYRAVIQTAGIQRFLEEDPLTLLARSEYSHMPMMGGATKHDGNQAFVSYYSSYFLPRGLDQDVDFLKYNLPSFVTSAFGIADGTGGISQTLTYSHFEESHLGNFLEMVPGIIDICSVLSFKAPVFKMLQKNSRVRPSYLYSFGYFGSHKCLDSVSLPFETGVGHSDELHYLFPLVTLLDDDLTVAKRMVSLWTSFARTGAPTVDGQNWEPIRTAFGPYLIIDEEFSNGTNYLSEYTIALQQGLTPVDRSD